MKILGKILSIFYCFIFCIILIVLSFLIFGSKLLDKSFYSELIKNTELSEIKAKDLGLSEDNSKSVEDIVVEKLKSANVDEKTSKAIINNDEIKEIAGEKIGETVSYIVGVSDKIPTVTKEEVKIILENSDVKKIVGDNLTEKDVNKLVDEVNNMFKEYCKDRGDINGN